MRWTALIPSSFAPSAPRASSPASAYAFQWQHTRHLVYEALGTDGQGDGTLHELYWSEANLGTGWAHTPLTASAGGPDALPSGAPFGYVFNQEPNPTQHVVYRAFASPTLQVQPVEELRWDGSWNAVALSQMVGSPNALTDPMGFAVGQQEYLTYLTNQFHPIVLTWLGRSNWTITDLTATSPDAPLAATSPFGYLGPTQLDVEGFSPQVVYVATGPGVSGHIVHAGRNAARDWVAEDATALAVGAPLATDSAHPVAYMDIDGRHQVYYVMALGGQIRRLTRDALGNWTDESITPTGMPAPADGAPLAAFQYAQQGTLHVVYLAQEGGLYDLWWREDSPLDIRLPA